MVTKLMRVSADEKKSFILAKIHMVTKPQKNNTIKNFFDKVLVNLFD